MVDESRQETAYIALGGNLASSAGDPEQTLRAALTSLAENGVKILSVSPFYSTPCFPAGAGPDFVNACAQVATSLSPVDLLACLHEVEAEFGRERDKRWAGRTLDLDLLAMGARILPDREDVQAWIDLPLEVQMARAPDTLILPHPRLHERGFVLIPLADIAPNWRHPILGKTVAEMCADLPREDVEAIKPL